MIEALLGNRSSEKVLLYLACYGEAYAGQVAKTFSCSLYAIQKQLQRLEVGGILTSQLKGNTRIYTWSPRFALKKELLILLNKALELLPKEEKEKYFKARTRPRRAGKPL